MATRRLSTSEQIRVLDWIRDHADEIRRYQWTYGKAAEVAGKVLTIEGLNASHLSTIHKSMPDSFPWPTSRNGDTGSTDQAETIDRLRRAILAILTRQPIPEDVAAWLELQAEEADIDSTRPLLA